MRFPIKNRQDSNNSSDAEWYLDTKTKQSDLNVDFIYCNSLKYKIWQKKPYNLMSYL